MTSDTPSIASEFTPRATGPEPDSLGRLGIGVVVINLLVIAWGAYVRASGSGAGCGSHWPLCNGVVVPRAPRIETIIELTHRGTSGMAMIAVFWLTWRVLRSLPLGHAARRPAIASAALMVLEALLGAGLVLFGWVDKDSSWARVVALGLHLTNTFLLLAALSLTAWRLSGNAANKWRREGVDAAVVMSMLGLALIVGITGAITSLGDTLYPAATVAQGMRNDFLPTAHFLERLRVVHPVLAVLTGLAVIRGSWLLARRRPSARTVQMGRLVATLVVAQIGLGVLNLALNAPTLLQLAHLLTADLLWMSIVLTGAAALAAKPA